VPNIDTLKNRLPPQPGHDVSVPSAETACVHWQTAQLTDSSPAGATVAESVPRPPPPVACDALTEAILPAGPLTDITSKG
jgi:hypothetical protein